MRTLALILIYSTLISCRDQATQPTVPSTDIQPIDSIDVSPLELFFVNSIAYHDSSFFLSSGQTKSIVKTNLHLKPLAQYRKPGHGPFELDDASDISVSEEHLYLIDFSQRKLVEFTHELIPVSEIVIEHPPFSIQAIREGVVWLGSLDMEYEDVYVVDFATKSLKHHGTSIKTKVPMEGLVFHSKNSNGDILRYRQYNHRLDFFPRDGSQLTFSNTLRPERPDVVKGIPGYPVFDKKIHHSAFLTADRACVLSGDHSPNNQPVQCFDFSGQLVARYSLKQDPSMISVYTDSTLYTYSPKTNHIYVYNLGF